MSPTLSPLSPITQVRGQSGVGDGPVLSLWADSYSFQGDLGNSSAFLAFCHFFKHMGNGLISGLESPVPSRAGPMLAIAVQMGHISITVLSLFLGPS